MGKSLFRIIAREKSRSNVLYPRVVLALGEPELYSTAAKGLLYLGQNETDGRATSVARYRSVRSRLLKVRSGRIKSYFNVNAAEARARGWDSFGNTQSRAKIRTLMQSRNAI